MFPLVSLLFRGFLLKLEIIYFSSLFGFLRTLAMYKGDAHAVTMLSNT